MMVDSGIKDTKTIVRVKDGPNMEAIYSPREQLKNLIKTRS